MVVRFVDFDCRRQNTLQNLSVSSFPSGPKLPKGIFGHATVTTKSAFYVIGGFTTYFEENKQVAPELQDSIYELSLLTKNSTWTKLPQKLSSGRGNVAAIHLPEELATCENE